MELYFVDEVRVHEHLRLGQIGSETIYIHTYRSNFNLKEPVMTLVLPTLYIYSIS